MLRRTLSIITISVVVALVGVLGLSLVTAQPSPSATRSFSPAMVVVPGGAVTVTIEASNYGQAGGVTETLPDGFMYVSSSLPDSQVLHTGQMVRFTLQGDDSFTYRVTASEMAGPHSFSGVLRETTGDVPANLPVGGESIVTVQSDAPMPTATAMPTPTATQRPVGGGASASRSFDMANVGTGDQIMVTIAASNYGQAGGVTETLPDGFMYVSSSLPDSQVLDTGQMVRFTLQGDDSFTYTVTASEMAGSHSFSGVLRETTGDVPANQPVGGESMVTVGPYATRSFNTDSVRQGGRVTVTIEASNYGPAGGVTETLPAGFTYVSSSLDADQVLHTGIHWRRRHGGGGTRWRWRHRWWRYARDDHPSRQSPNNRRRHPGRVQRAGEHDGCHLSERCRRENGNLEHQRGIRRRGIYHRSRERCTDVQNRAGLRNPDRCRRQQCLCGGSRRN